MTCTLDAMRSEHVFPDIRKKWLVHACLVCSEESIVTHKHQYLTEHQAHGNSALAEPNRWGACNSVDGPDYHLTGDARARSARSWTGSKWRCLESPTWLCKRTGIQEKVNQVIKLMETPLSRKRPLRCLTCRRDARGSSVDRSVSFTSGQLPTSAEIEEVRGLPCGALDLEFDAEEEVAHELHSQCDLWQAGSDPAAAAVTTSAGLCVFHFWHHQSSRNRWWTRTFSLLWTQTKWWSQQNHHETFFWGKIDQADKDFTKSALRQSCGRAG